MALWTSSVALGFAEVEGALDDKGEVEAEELEKLGWSRCKGLAKGPWRPLGDLRFIHIPRTMGTSIEACDALMPKDLSVTRWSPAAKKVPDHGSLLHVFPELRHVPNTRQKRTTSKCYAQHIPPQALLRTVPNFTYYSRNGGNFCVVRHPYDRLVSQFGFARAILPKSWGKGFSCNATDLNRYLKTRLLQVRRGHLELEDCHFLQQSYFVYGYDTLNGRTDRTKKWCDHTLRYEHLGDDFNALMQKYGYGLRFEGTLGTKVERDGSAYSSTGDCRLLGPEDLLPHVRRLADELYAEDFELFNYTRW